MIKNEFVQGSNEWKKWRESKIGASDAPVIMGVSPWSTPIELWEQKMGLAPEVEKTHYMRRGNDLEPLARDVFEKLTGLIFTPVCVSHPNYPWMTASLDGLEISEKCVLEIKCPGKVDHAKAMRGIIPEKYVPQLQHLLAVTGVDMLYYYSFDGKTGETIQVFRDEPYIKELIETELQFWECMQSYTPPKMAIKDFVIRSEDEDFKNLENIREAAKKDVDIANAAFEKANQQLIDAANGRTSIGHLYKITKTSRKGLVQYKEIPELYGVDLEQYRKSPTVMWTVNKI